MISTVTSSRVTAARNSRRAIGAAIALRGPLGSVVEPGPVVGRGTGRAECHRGDTPSWWWSGRGRTGSRRAHSQMPWARMRTAVRSAAGAARSGVSVGGLAAQPGAEGRALVGVEGDRDVEPVAGDGHGELVVAVGPVERGDVHLLVGAGPALLVGVDEVGVAVAVGVAHLDHHGALLAVGPEAPEDADRVEAGAERPRHRGHQHPAAALGTVEGHAAVGEEALDVVAQRPVRVAEVVARLEPAGEPAARAGSGRSVEVDQPGVRAVGERTPERPPPGVADRRVVDRPRSSSCAGAGLERGG